MSLQGPRGSRVRPTGSQGFKGYAYGVSGGLEVGLLGPRGSTGRPTGSQGLKGYAYRVSGGSRGWPTGSKGVKCNSDFSLSPAAPDCA